MLRSVSTVIFLLFAALSQSQNLLKPTWKFSIGDDLQWASVSYNDDSWKEILSGIYWERQGFENYDGYAWYRTSVHIPSRMRAESEKNGGMILQLGKIDDSDETYFNGEKIGSSGTLGPGGVSAYDRERRYTLPLHLIRWDQPNTIAIRVYDGGGGGGLYSQVASLSPLNATDLIAIVPKIPSADHVYNSSNNIEIPVSLSNTGSFAIKGEVKVFLKSDFGSKIFEQKNTLYLKPKSKQILALKVGKLEPGFYETSVIFECTEQNKLTQFSFAVSPENVISSPDPQPDFDAYWERAKKELAAVAPQYRLLKIDSLSTSERTVYLLEMRSLGNVKIRGWYAKPVREGKFPAILHVQGYGSFNQIKWGYSGSDFAVLVLNIRGHGHSADHINPGFPGYLQHFIDDKEMYVYRGAYMDTRRAVDFLYSRPEIDTTQVVVEGGSQGGALSIATAALNPERIALCLPSVPFLSDFRNYFKVADWPANEFKAYIQQHPHVGWEKVYETLSYIDIKNLAPKVKCPVLMAVGLRDDICPPRINFAMYNNLTCRKSYIIYPNAGHGLPGEFNSIKFEWIKKNLPNIKK